MRFFHAVVFNLFASVVFAQIDPPANLRIVEDSSTVSFFVATTTVDANTSGSSQSITVSGLSETPKLAFGFIGGLPTTPHADARFGLGATDGTNEWALGMHAEDALSGLSDANRVGSNSRVLYMINSSGLGIEADAHFSSWQTSGDHGINIEWDTLPSTAFKMTWVFWGGTDFEGAVGNANLTASQNGTQDYNVGFVPDFLIGTTESGGFDGGVDPVYSLGLGYAVNNAGTPVQRGMAISGSDASSTQNMSTLYRSSRWVIVPGINSTSASRSAELTDFLDTGQGDSVDGFEVTKRDGSFNFQLCWLAGRVDGYSVSLFDHATPTSTGTDAITDPGFTPQAILGIALRLVTSSTGTITNGSWSFIASDGPNDTSSHNPHCEDGASTMNNETRWEAEVRMQDSDGSDLLIADVDSFDASGFTLDWSSVLGSNNLRTFWLAFEEEAESSAGGIVMRRRSARGRR